MVGRRGVPYLSWGGFESVGCCGTVGEIFLAGFPGLLRGA